jgi:phosphomannomutase/phosphoglucomutase
MTEKPRSDLKPNTFEYENEPRVTANGFREYDARWLFGKELNLLGVQALGLGLGTYLHEVGVKPSVAVGHDFRAYSLSIKQALMLGLMNAGCGCTTSVWHYRPWPTSRNSRWIVRRSQWSRRATMKMAGPA